MRRGIAVGMGLWLGLAGPPSLPAGAADASTASSAALLEAAQAAWDRDDEASAFALLRRLAIADEPEGQHRLGLLLEQPRSRVPPDPDGAAYWYERAARQGHAAAAQRLGDLYASGAVGSFRSMGAPAPLVGEAVRWYWLAAEQGNGEALTALDHLRARFPLAEALLARASGDHATARAKLETLAKGNDLEALYWRGVMQERGEGGAPDPARAAAWYERGYQRGFGPAALALGRLHETGQGVPRDIDQAYRLYGAAGARGVVEAQAAIERLNFERRFGAPPESTVDGALEAMAAQMRALAASILHPLAAAGDVDAQHWLGTVAEKGRRSPADREEAIRWFRAAALQSDAASAHQLARLFDNTLDGAGRSLGDAAEKARWLRRAAEAGHLEAARELGEAYRAGQGVAADAAEAERWYRRAERIEAGRSALTRPACVEDASAPELLPAFLACNRGDATGLAGALVPLAEGGNARAQAWLGYLMAGGAGTGGGYDLRVQPNLQQAARWYAKAAERGLASALYDFGVVLEHGMGVPVDEAGARGWYERAAEQGHEPAKKALAASR